MAIEWGPASNGISVGIDVQQTPTNLNANTLTVDVKWIVYIRTENKAFTDDTQTMTMSNAMSAVETYTVNSTTSQRKVMQIWTGTQTLNTSLSFEVETTLKARVTQIAPSGGVSVHTRTWVIPIRPKNVPSPPPSTMRSRVSDTQINVTWTRAADANATQTQWESVEVVRLRDYEVSPALMATLGSGATSWSDRAVSAGHRYRYGVRSVNSGGKSNITWSNWVSTTPVVPTNVVATRQGTDAVITWTDNTPEDFWQVQEDGSTGTYPANSPTYIFENILPGSTYRYRVRAVGTDGLSSAWSAWSNSIIPLTAPYAPTNLKPSSGIYAVSQSLAFTWAHNPADTTAQERFELRWRSSANPGVWTTVGPVNSGTSMWQSPVDTFPAQSVIEWQVRTWGEAAGVSPWSALASFQVTTRPAATITVPADGATYDNSQLTVLWEYHHSGDHPQTAYQTELYEGAGTGGSLLERGESPAFEGGDPQWTADTALLNGLTYTVRLRVREEWGLWSEWVSSTFTVAFASPPLPSATVEWVEEQGYAEITMQANSEEGLPDPIYMRLERSIDGEAWEVLADNLPLNATYLDYTATMHGTNSYRVVSVSALPSESYLIVDLVMDGAGICDLFLSGGPHFEVSLRLHYVMSRSAQVGRERVLNRFAGRVKPVETSGVNVNRTLTVVVKMVPPNGCRLTQVERETLERLFEMPGPHLYRDRTGKRIYCSLSDLQISYDYLGDATFTVTETVGGTQDQLDAIGQYIMPLVIEPRPGEYTMSLGTLQQNAPGEWGWAPS